MSEKAKPFGGKIDVVLVLAPDAVAIVNALPKVEDDGSEPELLA